MEWAVLYQVSNQSLFLRVIKRPILGHELLQYLANIIAFGHVLLILFHHTLFDPLAHCKDCIEEHLWCLETGFIVLVADGRCFGWCLGAWGTFLRIDEVRAYQVGLAVTRPIILINKWDRAPVQLLHDYSHFVFVFEYVMEKCDEDMPVLGPVEVVWLLILALVNIWDELLNRKVDEKEGL